MHSWVANLANNNVNFNLLAWCGKEYYIEESIGALLVGLVPAFIAMIFGIIIYYKEYRKEKDTEKFDSIHTNEQIIVEEYLIKKKIWDYVTMVIIVVITLLW